MDAHLQTVNEKQAVEREIVARTRELTEALAVKTLLVHEIDHRVKNNLQMVASLLATQARAVADPQSKAIIQLVLARIEALGTMHKLLYQSDDVTRFDVAEFARALVTDLVPDNGRGAIRLRLDLESIVVPVERAPPIALILNELVTNALKHAFVDGQIGRLSVTVSSNGFDLRLEVCDDGVGMTPRTSSKIFFGQRLITSLARQLNATIDWTNADPGTCVVMRIPNGPVTVPVPP